MMYLQERESEFAMSGATATPPSRRTTLFVLVVAAVFAVVGQYGLQWLFSLLGYGWDLPKGRAIPAFVLFFAAGIVAFQRRRTLISRALALLIATTLAVPAWWLTPQNHVSLREAARLRDELKAESSSPPTWENASRAEILKTKHNELRQASRSMAQQIDLGRWANGVAEAIDEQFRKTAIEDIDGAVQTHNAAITLARAYSGPWIITISEWSNWIDKAMAAKKLELKKLARGDWAAFEHTASGRHALVHASSRSLEPLIMAEEKWVFETIVAVLTEFQDEMNPKLKREVCQDLERQLLSLQSLDTSSARFRNARGLLFRTAVNTADSEIKIQLEAKRFEHAYGIARKLAVDWFATAGILGPDQQKRLTELRENCRIQAERAEEASELLELAPTPRTRETAPFPRLKP
jgi:hypothetical protein